MILSASSLFAEGLISDFDLTAYNPLKTGLKDISCEVRVDGLTEQIKKQYVTINIKSEIYYQVYWMYPGRMGIEVIGIPRGFEQIKDSLVGLIANRLDYMVPQELSPGLRSYKFNQTKKNGEVVLEGQDPTNKMAVNKLEIGFSKDGVLKSYKSYSPLGFQKSNFTYDKKSWSKNKWVLSSVEADMIQGPQKTSSVTRIEYTNVAGYGMPEKIEIETKQSVVAPGKNEEKIARSGTNILNFSNYKLNNGEAQKYFRSKE